MTKIKILSAITLLLFISKNGYTINNYAIASNNEYNTELNIKGAYLMEKYTKKLKANLIDFENTYNIKNDAKFDDYIKRLDSIIYKLERIQRNDIDKEKTEELMTLMLKQLKDINYEIKILLKEKKEALKIELEKTKEKYSKVSLKLYSELNKLISKIVKYIKSKNNLDENDYLAIKTLKNIENEGLKLKNFNQNNFKNKTELKNYFLNILKSIKSNITNLKSQLKNT